jgi:hypothetical protein
MGFYAVLSLFCFQIIMGYTSRCSTIYPPVGKISCTFFWRWTSHKLNDRHCLVGCKVQHGTLGLKLLFSWRVWGRRRWIMHLEVALRALRGVPSLQTKSGRAASSVQTKSPQNFPDVSVRNQFTSSLHRDPHTPPVGYGGIERAKLSNHLGYFELVLRMSSFPA